MKPSRLGLINFLMAALFCGALPAAAELVDGSYVPARAYADTLIAEINSAKESVTAYMYIFALYTNRANSKAMQVADALGAAQARGVKVRVILDKATDYTPGEAENVWRAQGANQYAYDYLKAKGIDVAYEDSSALLHAKTVIIDGKTILVGSTNWSDNAFTSNLEGNTLLRSTAAAQALLADFSAMPSTSPAAVPAVPVPYGFFSEASHQGCMHSVYAFDIYLYLWYKANQLGTRQITLNYDEFAAHTGQDKLTRREYRKHTNGLLRRMQNKFDLLTIKSTGYGDDAVVELKPLPGDWVAVPRAYWDYGWNRRLAMPAKVMFMLSCYYSATSPNRPRWSMSGQTIARLNHIKPLYSSIGTTKLRRANLLEVIHSELPKPGQENRRPNIYAPKPLYNPQDLDKAWQDLAAQYGPDKLSRARHAAERVYADCDIHAIQILIELENQYGPETVARAETVCGKKNPSNPKRAIGYLINTIKTIGEGK